MNEAVQRAEDDPVLVSTIAPTRNQFWLAGGLVVALAAALMVTAPDAARRLENTEILLPAYAAAVLVIELITAALLLSLFYVQRSIVILILAAGYLFSGLLVAPWVLSFPDLFTAVGIRTDMQATASFAALRRLGFPVFVLAYALVPARRIARRRAAIMICATVAAVVCGVTVATLTIVSQGSLLPEFMMDARNPAETWRYIPPTAIVMYSAGLLILFLRRRTILDLWLMVVLCTLLIEIVQISYLGSAIRMSVGWWAGRLYGLASASIVLVVLLSETTAVYARLARSVAGERQARQKRLTAMEALSASIAHEINQPLASMVTNADAALRWLEKPEPQLDEARAAMRRIGDEGHRANKVVSGIRTMFMKGTRTRTRLDLNSMIEQSVRQASAEARLGRIVIELDLDCTLPPVIGNAIQLQQVLSNLIDNAVEAMRAAPARERVMKIVTRSVQHGEITVSIADRGHGLEPETVERIFDPFFTTKADGMGMGLMFCRATIESHGGRLWAAAGDPAGAVFSFSLPIASGHHDDSETGA